MRSGLPALPGSAWPTHSRRVETLVSVVKRKWVQALSARSEGTQRTQALLRGLVYNLDRLALLRMQPASGFQQSKADS